MPLNASGRMRILTTTICSSLLLFGSLGHAKQVLGEAELVERFVESPAFQSQLAAIAARTEAVGTGPALLANPELLARHDDARGPAGASTDALGAAITVDLGFASGGHRRGADLRGQAGAEWERAAALEGVCAFRGELVTLWEAQERARVSDQAHQRLEALVDQTTALAEAGDVPGFDRDRSVLVLSSHQLALGSALAALEAQRARVGGWTGSSVEQVELAPMTDAGSLEGLLQAAQEHPELRALRLEHNASGRVQAATRREVVPDLEVYGGARWDDQVGGSDPARGFEVGAALELPVFDLGASDRAQATAGLAGAEARLSRREAEVRARIEAEFARVASLDLAQAAPDTEALWVAGTERYFADEEGIGALVELAEDLEAAELATVDHASSLRRAQLDVSCAAGFFSDPTLQSALEGSLR
jgi:hypothetical protein